MDTPKLKPHFSFRWWIRFALCCLLLFLLYPFFGFFTTIGTVFWFGIAALPVLFVHGIFQSMKKAGWNLKSGIGTVTPLLAWACLAWSTWVEPEQLEVKELTIEVAGLTRELTLLHLSDIQSDKIDGFEEAVFERIKTLSPDLLIHTGDLVQVPGGDKNHHELHQLANLFKKLNPPLGKYHVLGDTDPGMPVDLFTQWSGVTTLRNGEVIVEKDGIRMALLGLTLASSRLGYADGIAEWLKRQPEGTLTLVAGHAPDYALTAGKLPVDLMLAGHTHGGQVRLPVIGPIMTLSEVPRDWARGHTVLEKSQLHVSAGIGAEHEVGLPSIRFNCPPEMTLLHLVPKP